MKDYFKKSMEALQLAGMSKSTQECYTSTVRKLVEFYDKTPDKISEEELRAYFLHRINVTGWADSNMRICYSGIKFFFINVLKRDWQILDIIHAKREQRLPTVLSVHDVWKILNAVNTPQHKSYLTTVYNIRGSIFKITLISIFEVNI